MLINLSNHPSSKWQEKQTEDAIRLFDKIVDISFPKILPEADNSYIKDLTLRLSEQCENILFTSKSDSNAVHVMGEFTLSFAIVSILAKNGIRCVASTTERIVEEINDKRTIIFNFKQFRDYQML